MIRKFLRSCYKHDRRKCCIRSTIYAELTVGREYGAGNAQGIADEFKVFRHCYIRLLLIHIPVTMLLGWAYLSITHVTDMTFALILLFARVACEIAYYTELPARRVLYIFGNIKPAMLSDLTFALVLLAVRMLSASVYYVGLPAMRILYIFGVVRPVMLTRLFGLCIMQLLVQWISLELGADAFCIPISYFAADFIWGIMNVWLIRKHKFLKTSSIIMEVNT